MSTKGRFVEVTAEQWRTAHATIRELTSELESARESERGQFELWKEAQAENERLRWEMEEVRGEIEHLSNLYHQSPAVRDTVARLVSMTKGD